MRSATTFVVIAALVCLGNTGKAIPQELSTLNHPHESGVGTTEDYIDTEVEQFIEHVAETRPESHAPIRSWSIFPISNFLPFPCGPGRRADANGRCRPIYLYERPIKNQN